MSAKRFTSTRRLVVHRLLPGKAGEVPGLGQSRRRSSPCPTAIRGAKKCRPTSATWGSCPYFRVCWPTADVAKVALEWLVTVSFQTLCNFIVFFSWRKFDRSTPRGKRRRVHHRKRPTKSPQRMLFPVPGRRADLQQKNKTKNCPASQS